mgnify:CR=1 FL=1
MTTYKYTDSNGRVIYSDSPPDPHKGQRFAPSDLSSNQCYTNMFCGNPEVKKKKTDYEKAKEYIADAQKHIPKIKEYLEVLSYLKSHDEAAYKVFMNELETKNPKAWILFQRSPQLKSLQEIKQFDNNAKAGAKVISSQVTGKALSNDDFLDAWYARVKTNAQSRGYVEGKPNLSSLAASRLAPMTSAGVAVGRVAGVPLQIGTWALDPQNAVMGGEYMLRRQLEKLAKREYVWDQVHGNKQEWTGKQLADTSEEYLTIKHLIDSGQYIAARKMMDDWMRDNK